MNRMDSTATRAWIGGLVAFAAVATWLAVSSGHPALVAEEREVERILADARLFTLQQEGMVGHTYQPTPESGITICYGYDMGRKSRARVEADLDAVLPEIPDIWVERLAGGAGRVSGTAAFIAVTSDIELSPEQCASLFDSTYAAETAAARSFATEPDTYADLGVAYPPADWDALHPAIEGIVIDMKFRGDYRPWWSEQQDLQQAIVDNDPDEVLRQIQRPEIFPADLASIIRFQARIDWMARILARL